MRTLAWIVGSAYSGSSLLTALLDQNPHIAAIGEGATLYAPVIEAKRRVCWRCRSDASECELWNKWDGSESLVDFCDREFETQVVIDSTKDPSRMLAEWQGSTVRPPIRAIHLSKSPIEQIGSYWRHQEWKTPRITGVKWSPAECVDQWITLNYWYHGFLQVNHIPTLQITYSDMAHHTDNVLATVASFLGIHNERSDERSHTLGGNPSVIAAASGDDELGFRDAGRNGYLDGKYKDQSPGLNVEYDESWRSMDSNFARCVNRELARRRREVLPLMQLLGHADLIGD